VLREVFFIKNRQNLLSKQNEYVAKSYFRRDIRHGVVNKLTGVWPGLGKSLLYPKQGIYVENLG